MSDIEIKIKRKHDADAMSCICKSLKIAQALNEVVYLEMDGYSLPISKDSKEIDIYRIYELEEKLKKK